MRFRLANGLVVVLHSRTTWREHWPSISCTVWIHDDIKASMNV